MKNARWNRPGGSYPGEIVTEPFPKHIFLDENFSIFCFNLLQHNRCSHL